MTQINSESTSVALLESEKSTQIQYTDFEGLLRIYYERLFPFKKFHRWLTLGSQFPFENREFSFTLADDIYLRFQSFQDEKDIDAKVAKLCPYKIDIGAVYNARPSDRKNINPNAFKPMEKELVFDIDMTDYDDVRKCCKDKKICAKCWKFVAIAAKILDTALAEDFGFQHRLWVFSGRRGIHCWVSDVNAKKLAQNARKAVIGYLEIIRGGDELRKKVHFSTCLHPFVERSKELLEDYFEDIVLVEQTFLLESQECEKVLYMIPDENLRQRIRQKWADTDSLGSNAAEICIKKWEILKNQINSYEPGKKVRLTPV